MFESGLTYVKADFHLHTHKDKEFKYSGENNSFVKDYVAGLKNAGVQLGVITNHNKFDKDEYVAIRKAAKKENIFILPGVELSVKEGANGVHTLIVFNPGEWLSNGENHIQSFLATAFASIPNPENIILEGAPGVGKTFVAKRLAYSIMGMKDVNRVMMVQFHQSYSYEDFIMGFRPSGNGFELKKGAFYNFCKKAELDSEHDYFFIIDEINRGNLSKIFGELFMLIENDKRGSKNKVQLLYSDELFFVPDNVYIIGMMNTADRSLAMLDYALRRRFAFFDLKPGFSSEGFRAYQAELDNRKFDSLIQCVERLNDRIAADESLGEGFCIGHSYFSNITPEELNDAKLSGIVEYELIPLLKEYWFDEPLKIREWSENLRSAIK